MPSLPPQRPHVRHQHHLALFIIVAAVALARCVVLQGARARLRLVRRLLRRGDFHSARSLRSWHERERKDILKDMVRPFHDKRNDVGGIVFRRGKLTGLVRPVLLRVANHSAYDDLPTSNATTVLPYAPQFLLLSLEYSVRGRFVKGTALAHVNLRHDDGTRLPLTLRADLPGATGMGKQRLCRWIPVARPMLTVLASVGAVRLEAPAGAAKSTELVVHALNLDAYRHVRNANKIESDATRLAKSGSSQDHRLEVSGANVEGDELMSAEMLSLCAHVASRSPRRFHTLPYAFEATYRPKRDDVTVATRLSMDRLSRLSALVRRYQGPVSACVLVRSRAEQARLRTYWLNDPLLRHYADVHVLYDTRSDQDALQGRSDNSHEWDHFDKDVAFPVNLARNVARKHSRTDYVLYLDADFVTSSDLRKDIKDGRIVSLLRQLHPQQKAVIILPAYRAESLEHVPRTRAEMLGMLRETKSTRLRRSYYQSFKFVNYNKWERSVKTADGRDRLGFYEIAWYKMLPFEPYFIGPRSMPLFSERYYGTGRNKIQRTYTTHLAGFKMFVWRKHFIVHLAHPDKDGALVFKQKGTERRYAHYFVLYSNHIMTFKEFFEYGLLDNEDTRRGSSNTVLDSATAVHERWLARTNSAPNDLVSSRQESVDIDLAEVERSRGVSLGASAMAMRFVAVAAFVLLAWLVATKRILRSASGAEES